jgi:hypothetical protein
MQRLTGEARREAAAKALARFEEALVREPDERGRFSLLPDLAKVALEAGEWDKARAYATELLEKESGHGPSGRRDEEATHYGNLVLGRLALREGDVAKAKEHLLESANTPGSPVQCSFGPNMALAKEQLERGERGAVVEYRMATSTCRKWSSVQCRKRASYSCWVATRFRPWQGRSLSRANGFRPSGRSSLSMAQLKARRSEMMAWLMVLGL